MKAKYLYCVIIIIFCAGFYLTAAHSDESITFTTYYPAPYGVYNDLNVMHRLGIGTTNPQAKLTILALNTAESELVGRTNNDVNDAFKLDADSQQGVLRLLDQGTVKIELKPQGDSWFNNSGKVGIGTTTPGGNLHIYNDFGGAGGSNRYLLLEQGANVPDTNYYFFNFLHGATSMMNAKANGNMSIAGTLTQGSDIRLKEEINPIENGLEKVNKLRGVTFYWKDKASRGNQRQIGLIAQEMEKEFPELVTTNNDGYKGIAYDKFTAVLLEAIKTQQTQIKSQQAQINNQQTQIDNLKAGIEQLKNK